MALSPDTRAKLCERLKEFVANAPNVGTGTIEDAERLTKFTSDCQAVFVEMYASCESAEDRDALGGLIGKFNEVLISLTHARQLRVTHHIVIGLGGDGFRASCSCGWRASASWIRGDASLAGGDHKRRSQMGRVACE